MYMSERLAILKVVGRHAVGTNDAFCRVAIRPTLTNDLSSALRIWLRDIVMRLPKRPLGFSILRWMFERKWGSRPWAYLSPESMPV